MTKSILEGVEYTLNIIILLFLKDLTYGYTNIYVVSGYMGIYVYPVVFSKGSTLVVSITITINTLIFILQIKKLGFNEILFFQVHQYNESRIKTTAVILKFCCNENSLKMS